MAKVSVPVVLNEPVSGLQRIAETFIQGDSIMSKAAIEEDPVKRLALAVISTLQAPNSMRMRKKKPFNPMLGETYELVTDEFKIVAEKVQHTPT